ncbi:DegV family protein [Bacillota bacterium Meth-B3]|nr:DegV family protein [Christensenellaceae bacterium]
MTRNLDYTIVVDATIDLPEELFPQVQVIPMQVQIGADTLSHASNWSEQQSEAFYARLRAGELPSTSQISPYAYEQAFERALEGGGDALYLGLSSGLSDTVAQAQLAANAVAERCRGQRVVVVDSLSATYGETLMLEAALDNRARGMTAEENARWLAEHRHEFATWFTVEDLMYLRHGGRISSAAALLGSALRIMPILRIDESGKLPVVEKIQGRKSAIKQLVRRMEKHISAHARKVYVIHADVPEEAELLRRLAQHARPDAQVIVGGLGPVIGGHVGPGVLALAFRGNGR